MRLDPVDPSLGLILRHCSHRCEAGRPRDGVEGHGFLLVVLAIHNRLTHLAASIATGNIGLEFLTAFANFDH